MKTFKKALAVISVIAIVLSCFSFAMSASATSAVSSVNCQNKSSKYGGNSTFFYVKANSTTCKIKFTCGKGKLDWAGENLLENASVYGAYQVKIYKWDAKKGSTVGSCVFDKDIYNKSSYTASFKAEKGAYYRVQVYFWVCKTTANSYWNKGIIKNPYILTTLRGVYVGYYGTPNWVAYPSIKATNSSGCTLYASKP